MSQLRPVEIKPVHNPVFQTVDSLADVLESAQIALKDQKMTPNTLRILFGVYHNTLLCSIAKSR